VITAQLRSANTTTAAQHQKRREENSTTFCAAMEGLDGPPVMGKFYIRHEVCVAVVMY
jgi:hypothetical protein